MNRLFCALALFAFAVPAAAAEFSPAQKQEMEKIIRDYLMQHPEVIEDMAKLLEQKQQAAQEKAAKEFVTQNAKEIFRAPADLVLGNPKGSVTIVEFFDYNCGWCKKGFPEVMTLLEKDKDLRLVVKEFPVLSDDSVYASRAVIAAGKQGKRREMHMALLPFEGHVSQDVVQQIAAANKLDMPKLIADMASPDTEAELATNQQMANSLGVKGTPSFLVGDKFIPGYAPPGDLTAIVNEIRQTGVCAKLC
jgi:protein-disulfide isomerase